MQIKVTSKLRLALLIIVAIAAIAAATLMLGTESGREFLSNPRDHGKAVRRWVDHHPVRAPVAYVSAYVLLGALAFPVWWLPIIAGSGFGLFGGIVWTQIGSTIAAVVGASLSRFLFADWFHQRVESHAARLRTLDEKLGHNGLLVVCMVRLAHFIPAGISNYAFGLTTISLRDVALGTFFAGIPSTALEVAVGAASRLREDWRFLLIVGILNIVLFALLVLRYLRPSWFKSFGIE